MRLRRAAAIRGSLALVALALGLGLGLGLGCGGAAPRAAAPAALLPASEAGPPDRLIVIAIAGLGPAWYRGEAPAMPTLAALARVGVSADALSSVAPAAEYPAHATLVTGRHPAGHGIVADHLLGEHGVRSARSSHASLLRAPTLWQAASEANRVVAALAWPTTVGAAIPLLVPDITPDRGQSWVESLRGAATPRLIDLVREVGGPGLPADPPAAARDAVLVDVACRLLEESAPPDLLLLHLSGAREAVARAGLEAPETRLAFAAADAEVARVLACLARSKRLARSAIAVAGDHGAISLHTVIAPNAVLVHAGLGTPDPRSGGLQRWSALARSNGGSAFVYAEDEDDALLARRALEDEAARTGAFRVVPAATLLRLGADPAAWFGLEAEPGYAFSDATTGPRLAAAAGHAVGGYLPDRVEMDAGFVAFGPGLRRGVRVPRMGLVDVAPTLARLVGLPLPEADGHALVGLLEAAGG